MGEAESGQPQEPGASRMIRVLAVILPLSALVVGGYLIIQRLDAREAVFEIDQSSPEALFTSAARMVREGRADLLTELLYAHSEGERAVLRGVGGVLGALQRAAYAAAEAYPDEIRRVRAQAQQAAQEGKASNIFATIAQRMGMNPSRGNIFRESDDPGADAIASLLADPFGWIERNGEKLGTMSMGDRMAGVTWDGRPVLMPFPLMMELKEDDKWYVVLPTNLPGVRRAIDEMIEEDDRREMILLILQSVRQAFDDLALGMRSGEIRNLDHAANKLGEYAMPPVGLGIIAFSRYMEIARQAEREQRRREREQKDRHATGTSPGDGDGG